MKHAISFDALDKREGITLGELRQFVMLSADLADTSPIRVVTGFRSQLRTITTSGTADWQPTPNGDPR